MHDLDRTAMEFEWETNGYGNDEFGDEYEYEYENYEDDEYDEYEYEYEYESPLSDAEEMELAAELLEITSDEELDMFLGKLFRKVGRGFRKFARSKIGRSLGGILKSVAKKALPIAGSALGSIVPGVGTALGAGLGSAAGRLFGLELEGMSPEDQEFEIARRYVRLATEAAKQASRAPAGASPSAVANKAMTIAASKHAPGLLGGHRAGRMDRRKHRGMWKRRGNTIVLYGI